MQLRPYQQEAVDAVYRFLCENAELNPCVVAPTGAGKSVIIAQLVMDVVTRWDGRVLLLAHVKELLEQNAEKIQALCPTLDIGLHSAGLGRYDTKNAAIVAGIQSVYRKAELLGRFDLVIVDEAHLISPSGDGMYRTLLAKLKTLNPQLRIVGLTATPYRLDGGLICKPENFLNAICYDIKVTYLIEQGYISRLVSQEGVAETDFSAFHLRGGEFVNEEVVRAMDSADLVERACAEIVQKTQARKHVLIFGASVSHCQHIAQTITRLTGEECPVVTGETSKAERANLLERFKGTAKADLFGTERVKPLKFLANVNVLTTGFDAPCIDCVVLLRPTASTALYVQMVGRGFRLAPGKQNCLILDYGGNVLRHGPVNDVQVSEDGPAKTKRARVCPQCRTHLRAKQQICHECGYTFPPPTVRAPPKTRTTASTLEVVGRRTQAETHDVTYEVLSTRYFVHEKRGEEGAAPSLRIEHQVFGQVRPICLWKCPQHPKAWVRHKFASWWRGMARNPDERVPKTAKEAVLLNEVGAVLKQVSRITLRYREGSNFPEDIGYEFAPEPCAEEAASTCQDDLPF